MLFATEGATPAPAGAAQHPLLRRLLDDEHRKSGARGAVRLRPGHQPVQAPGLFLKKEGATCLARWQYVAGSTTTISGTPRLTLFSSWGDSLLLGETDPRTLGLTVTLRRVVGGVTTTSPAVPITYTHSVAWWQTVTASLESLPATTLQAGDRVELSVACGVTTQSTHAGCHLGYDVTGLPASLTLPR